MEFLAQLMARGGRTPADEDIVQLIQDYATGGNSALERVRFRLDVSKATFEQLGPGFWVYVESGGNAGVSPTTKPHYDAKDDKFKHSLTTGAGIMVPFQEAIIRIPTGLTGTMVLQVARYPIPFPFHRRIQIVDSSGDLITSGNPLPVNIVHDDRDAGAPLATTGIGASSVQAVAANADRQGVYLRNTSASGQILHLGFNDNDAEPNKGVKLLPEEPIGFNGKDRLGPGTKKIMVYSSAASGRLQYNEF